MSQILYCNTFLVIILLVWLPGISSSRCQSISQSDRLSTCPMGNRQRYSIRPNSHQVHSIYNSELHAVETDLVNILVTVPNANVGLLWRKNASPAYLSVFFHLANTVSCAERKSGYSTVFSTFDAAAIYFRPVCSICMLISRGLKSLPINLRSSHGKSNHGVLNYSQASSHPLGLDHFVTGNWKRLRFFSRRWSCLINFVIRGMNSVFRIAVAFASCFEKPVPR